MLLDPPSTFEASNSDASIPTPPSPSLMAPDYGTIEPQFPLRLDRTLTPGVYRIVNDESSNIVIDLSGYDKSSILGKFRSYTRKHYREPDLTVWSAYEAHGGENQKV